VLAFAPELGARTEVWMTDGKGSIEVNINGERAFAPVTEYALRRILKDEPYDINVITVLGLPISQGFGTSAAGALSASLALCSLLDRPSHEGYEAAHESEIMNRTGMGDVSAMFRGGMTFRRKEGLPPLARSTGSTAIRRWCCARWGNLSRPAMFSATKD